MLNYYKMNNINFYATFLQNIPKVQYTRTSQGNNQLFRYCKSTNRYTILTIVFRLLKRKMGAIPGSHKLS